ncbi:hypothetical protein BJ742DRAFT_903524 [Cladochytrium replicatum]|nr:hypothetical protein BJ742DRAFT_903524 [Cladochytrium replicatum]
MSHSFRIRKSGLLSYFVESLAGDLWISLNVDDTKRIGATLTAVANEKQNALKEVPGKKKERYNQLWRRTLRSRFANFNLPTASFTQSGEYFGIAACDGEVAEADEEPPSEKQH